MAGSRTRKSGLVLELDFALACISKGATVSQPFGDNAHYDLLVDDGKKIHRVQVKKSSPKPSGTGYSVNITRKLPKMRPGDEGGSSKAVAYKDGELDCVATEANGVWFFFGPEHLKKDATVYPHAGKDKYVGNHGKNKWSVVGLEPDPDEEPNASAQTT
jgi:hypothetical protein